MKAHGWLGPLLLKTTDVLITNSHKARYNLLRRGVLPSRIYLLPNVLDLSHFDRLASRPGKIAKKSDEIIVVAVARLARLKRLDRFIAAIADARAILPNLRGVIAGEGPQREDLYNLAEKLNLAPAGIFFAGHCENIPAFLSQADIFVLTSEHEGFPNVILEAMAAGLPVVTVPVGDSTRMIADGVNGFVVAPDDLQNLSQSIELLAQSANLRLEMGKTGRRLVEELYDANGMQTRVLEILKEIAERRKDKRLLALLPTMNGSIQVR
jgi:glycosyltransferase involved in cell wall biosynthesis